MQTISLCMIVKNEESFLEQCLNSVKDLVDEIIIVDTGSTDKTKEIAARFTNKIYDFKWCDDFSAARNGSLKHATCDWILILDADETLSKKDHSGIRDTIKATEAIAFSLIHRNYTDDSSAVGWVTSKGDGYAESKMAAGWYPVPIIRLFRNNKDIVFKGLVHELVYDSAVKKGKIVPLNIPIHHYGKLDPDRVKERYLLYEKIGKDKLRQDKDWSAYYELGRQLLHNKKFEEAIRAFENSIELKRDYFRSWYMLGSAYLLLGDLDSSLTKLRRARSLNPRLGPAYAILGVVYIKKGEFKKAVKNFMKAVELNPSDATTYVNMGLCFDKMGERQKAYSCFKKAIELNPKYKETIRLG